MSIYPFYDKLKSSLYFGRRFLRIFPYLVDRENFHDNKNYVRCSKIPGKKASKFIESSRTNKL